MNKKKQLINSLFMRHSIISFRQ